MQDVSSCWKELSQESPREPASSVCAMDGMFSDFGPNVDADDLPVHTIVSFADRKASQMAANQIDTQVALAELYAHVSKMPDSTKKKKILKQVTCLIGSLVTFVLRTLVLQFTKANGFNTPHSEKNHKRSRSLGESLKKIVTRHHKRQTSGNSIQLHSISSTDSVSTLISNSSLENQENQQPVVAQNNVPVSHSCKFCFNCI
jgi:hypothetical protein